ncbi:hypothetical protein B0H16DRAFT_1703542 [Mycena metata]|uniref:HNH nuclease domain-containing protein n=1 Tax=Mycena metata TaxID=1033252 RepID=A0AAD7H384_9AGAR|nr:hypothetical protein B0H16DRAFT_1703542 [Mycena metata]
MEAGTLSNEGAKALASERDGDRCLVTGVYTKRDPPSAAATQYKEETLESPKAMNAAHIILEHLNFSEDKIIDAGTDEFSQLLGFPENSNMNQAWMMLKIYGSPNIVDELEGTQIHSITNILTLCVDIHDTFDSMRLWFEATGRLNEYNVCLRSEVDRPTRASGFRLIEEVKTVVFPSTDELPAPSSNYLAIHAACCRIAHMSGAADHFAKIERDLDEFRTPFFVMSPLALQHLSHALDFGYTGRSAAVP